MKFTFGLLSFLCFFAHFSFAQIKTPRRVHVTGQISAENESKPVSFASIFIKKNKTGNISDSAGYYTLNAEVGDLLRISSVGYQTEYIYIHDSLIKSDNSCFIKTKLKKQLYTLKEVVIVPDDWIKFKKKVLEAELTSTLYKEVAEKWTKEGLTQEFMSGLRAKTPGFTLNFNDGKQEKRLFVAQLESEREREKRALSKVMYLAGRFTGLKNSDLEDFVLFCNFDTNTILQDNDYDVTIRIKRNYEMYRRRR